MYNLFKRKEKNIQDYHLKFKLSFPKKTGNAETEVMNVVIPATSIKEAEEKLNTFVQKKIKVIVTESKESQKKEESPKQDIYESILKKFKKHLHPFTKSDIEDEFKYFSEHLKKYMSVIVLAVLFASCIPPKFTVNDTQTFKIDDSLTNCLYTVSPQNQKAMELWQVGEETTNGVTTIEAIESVYAGCGDYKKGDVIKLTRKHFANLNTIRIRMNKKFPSFIESITYKEK